MYLVLAISENKQQKRGLSPDEDNNDIIITEEPKQPRQEEGQVEGVVRQDNSQNPNNNPKVIWFSFSKFK